MKKIGITGKNGFVGSYLTNILNLYPSDYKIIPFERHYFDDQSLLDSFCTDCDVIVHLAGINRHENEQVIYDTNISLSQQLVDSLNRTGARPQIMVSSSTQESRDNLYGNSKKKSREILLNWAKKNNVFFTGLIIPNVFGPFGRPFYNSVVATFCSQLTEGSKPLVQTDSTISLIYVGELVTVIKDFIDNPRFVELYELTPSATLSVTELLRKLEKFKQIYMVNKSIPKLAEQFDFNLFNTFRSYIDVSTFFPQSYKHNTDPRGTFVEIIRIESGGQTSFSTTHPGVTRGNHFHTRKIERFAVVRGKALIQLRRIGHKHIHEFVLDGTNPAFVDMPIWYTHNIKNIGEGTLYTIFWINEPFNQADPDTYFEIV